MVEIAERKKMHAQFLASGQAVPTHISQQGLGG